MGDQVSMASSTDWLSTKSAIHTLTPAVVGGGELFFHRTVAHRASSTPPHLWPGRCDAGCFESAGDCGGTGGCEGVGEQVSMASSTALAEYKVRHSHLDTRHDGGCQGVGGGVSQLFFYRTVAHRASSASPHLWPGRCDAGCFESAGDCGGTGGCEGVGDQVPLASSTALAE